MRRQIRRGLYAAFLLNIVAAAALAQGAPRLDYTLGIKDAAQHLFHLKIQVSNLSGASARSLDIAIPAWTPGWYMIKPYAACVQRLQAHDNGRRLPLRALDKQSYRIDTGGLRAFTIEYDYYANDLAVNGAELTDKRGYFLGTNLFFYVPGHSTGTPSTLKFDLPAGWRVATGLKRGSEPNTYLARDFDNLVDCPTVVGDFDEEIATVRGKPIHIVIDPKGSLNEAGRARLKDMTASVIESQAKMFGGLPYDEYWILFVGGSNVRGGGALEHENSTNLMFRQMPTDPKNLMGGVTHEHFHVWNVKRIKPAGLIPYDYLREQYTKELWFAEGVTNYYTDVHMLRGGLITREEFLMQQGGQIGALQRSESRQYVSLADASITTWLTYGVGPGGPPPFTVNYYNKGQVVGFLLDLELRGATKNQKTLDDLLRLLWESFYKKGRGYTNDDLEKAASQLAGRSLSTFFARYVNGTDELDYNATLVHAGLRLEGNSIVEVESATDDQKRVRQGLMATEIRAQGVTR